MISVMATAEGPVSIHRRPRLHHVTPTLKAVRPVPVLDMDRFRTEAEKMFTNALTPDVLQTMSAALLTEYERACQMSDIGMLPSFCHTLPTGEEIGRFLAVDVGGSTLRVALTQLNGRRSNGDEVTILKCRHHVIDETSRGLIGRAFFSWIADRIAETLEGDDQWLCAKEPLHMGLAWSFPIE